MQALLEVMTIIIWVPIEKYHLKIIFKSCLVAVIIINIKNSHLHN